MTNKEIFDEKCEMLVDEATRYIGTVEEGGDNKGSKVEEFQRAVDGKAQGEPWCCAFVQYCVKRVDSDYDTINQSCFEQSWLYKTEHVMTLWNRTPIEARVPLESVMPGCLMLWQYWKDGKPTGSGHIGVVVEVLPDGKIKTIEGNTGPGAGVEREGDGVYEKIRNANPSGNMRVQGFLAPWVME